MSRRLSVILAVFNGMPYLPETVESILGQSFQDFTFIIVDDGSTDGTAAYLESLTDERIQLIHQSNMGQGAARNAGLNQCQTEYAAITDADDISLPDRLQREVDYLDGHPDVVLLGTQVHYRVGTTIQKAFRVPLVHEEIEQQLLRGGAAMCHSSLMMRTTFARAAGCYPQRAVAEDIEFCLRMCELGRVANIDEVLIQYRIHPSATTITKSTELARALQFACHSAICRRAGLPEPSMDAFLRNASWIDRCRWMLEANALIQFRKSRIAIAEDRRIEGLARLTLAGFCRPFQGARRIVSLLSTKSWKLKLAGN